MRFVLLAATVLSMAAAGLAGCLEDDLSLMTARQALGKADREAAGWADDAELTGAFGLEAGPGARAMLSEMSRQAAQPGAPGARGMGEEDDEERAVFGAVAGTEDSDAGDGRAPVWAFTYRSASREAAFHVAVSSQGTILAREAGDGDGVAFLGGGKAVGDWAVDSAEGAEVALLDESYAAAVADPHVMAYTTLFQGKDGPVWIFGAEAQAGEDGDGGDGAMVAVSAVDGSPIDADEVLQEVLGFTLREAGQFGGTVAAQAMGSFGGPFDVQLGGHEVLVVLVAVSPPPALPMQVTVTDPEGMEHTATIDPAVGLEATRSLVIEEVPPGEYDVSVTTDVALAHDYEVSWCTDGEALAPVPSAACGLLGSGFRAAPLRPLGVSPWETLSPLGRSPPA